MLKTKMKLALGTALIVTPIQAWAQDTAADAPQTTRMTLDRMVISAGTEKVAIDTPQAVSTLDQDDIDQVQATTIGDLLEGIPGVNVQGGVGPLGQCFNIRGMGTAIGDSDNRILLTVDGVTKFYEQYRMGALFSEPELYKRVEVLRGPASSTLYGAGRVGGRHQFHDQGCVRLSGRWRSAGGAAEGCDRNQRAGAYPVGDRRGAAGRGGRTAGQL